MKTKSSPIILSNLMISGLNKTCTFREITETNELDRLFHFRYEEYSKSRMSSYLRNGSNEMDIDIFDLHSKHFGLFNIHNELVGCLRVVLDRKGFYNPNVFEVGKKNEIFIDSTHSFEGVKNSNDAEFPFLSYPNLSESIKSHYESIKTKNESVAEASRLIIRGDLRGLRTSVFLIECAMMLFILICSGQRHAVLHCFRDHRAFYERYGFRPFDDGQGYKTFGIIKDVMFLPLTSTTIPSNLRSKFEKMAIEYSETGKISRAL
jgi:predicted GNAT family N-acyltransferase